MLDDKSMAGRCLGLFLLGWFLFSYPVLTIFNLPDLVLGVPLFFLYLFTAWLVLMLLVFMFAVHSDTADAEPLAPDRDKKGR